MARKEDLLLFFDRPQEPVFAVKGEEKAVFDVPENFITDRYRKVFQGPQVINRLSDDVGRMIPIKNISIPDLRIPMSLGRREFFSLFIPKHREIASRLIDIFMGLRSLEDVQSVAAYARDRLNPLLFNYALSVAILHRPDTKGLNLPTLLETFPDRYVDSKVFNQIREEANVVPDGSRMPIIIPRDYTASDLEEEHRLWYFREDMGVNIHHWHWHLIYPTVNSNRAIVAKDRRGELFFYMHQQLVARYNMERFSNNLARVKRFNNLREPIKEGYFPKMDSLVASRAWPPRFANSTLKDLNRELDQIRVDISDLERWRDRIYGAIHQGYAVDAQGNQVPFDEERGMDMIGNIVEGNLLSVNRQLYGDLHAMGHVFLSFIHDPDHRNLESFGVMGDAAVDMRDPIFYRWHAYIDDVFQEYKETLNPYTAQQLDYPGITLTGLQVQPEGGQPNILTTFWQQSDINLSRGMDFVPRGNVFARFTHLQHNPFTFTININNASDAQRFGTVRIFIASKVDERNQEMLLRDQRHLMVELDKFIVQLRPGQNTVRRRSNESSVTIPFERTFRNLDQNRPVEGAPNELEFNFCGCGWPNHMLIPKGRPEGMRCELFVMVSNYDDDRVDQDLVGQCSDAAPYCGVRDRLYPDRRPMGYPFDRLPRAGVDRLSQFLTGNMRSADITIRHNDVTQLRQ